MARERNVLLALGYYDHRFHVGVARYAREHGWHLAADMAYSKRVPWGWQGDGVLAKAAAEDELSRFIEESALPVVNVGRGQDLDVPLVLIDEAPLVEMAVEHFTVRGFRHFAYVGAHPRRTRQRTRARRVPNRGELYVQALADAGRACTILDWYEERGTREDTWVEQRTWLIERLRGLPKPGAVFCWDDSEAAGVIQACRSTNIQVPEEVAVLGVNNDELVCEALSVPLSSIDTDMEGRAYRAAELLDRKMNGEKIPDRSLVPPKVLVTRRSTDILAVPHEDVALALRFIWEHAHQAISVEDVARAAAISPRGLHKAFRTHMGRPPIAELQRVRILRAQKMLRETAEKMTTIARKTGYGSVKSMFRAFKQQLGTTPKQYRQDTGKGQ